MYGRNGDSLDSFLDVFVERLGDLPGHKVAMALAKWLDTKEEFPTIAGIRDIVQTGDKPKLSRDIYLSLKAKQRYDRDYADDEYIKRYEAQERGEAYEDTPRRKVHALPEPEAMVTPEEAARRAKVAQESYETHGIHPDKPQHSIAADAVKSDLKRYKPNPSEKLHTMPQLYSTTIMQQVHGEYNSSTDEFA